VRAGELSAQASPCLGAAQKYSSSNSASRWVMRYARSIPACVGSGESHACRRQKKKKTETQVQEGFLR